MRYDLARARDFFRPLGLFEELDHDMGSLFSSKNFVPAVDFSETEKELHLSIDLPGMEKDDVTVEMKNSVLTINGKREASRKEGGFSERRYGSFQRSFTLPKSADSERVEAKFENGVLDITVAKREEVQAKRIEVS